MPPEALLAPFLVLLAAAALSDVATMEIPNWISLGLAVGYVPAAALAGLDWTLISAHLGFGAAAFAVCALLFSLGLMGGGDAKLIAAAAVWTGWAALPSFVLATAVAGGVLALAALAARCVAAPSASLPAFANRLLEPGQGVPYAVAIAAGGFAAAPLTPLAGLFTLP